MGIASPVMSEYGLHERECLMISFYAAIDPLALLLPTDVYSLSRKSVILASR